MPGYMRSMRLVQQTMRAGRVAQQMRQGPVRSLASPPRQTPEQTRNNFAGGGLLLSFIGCTYYYSVRRMSVQDDLEEAAEELGARK